MENEAVILFLTAFRIHNTTQECKVFSWSHKTQPGLAARPVHKEMPGRSLGIWAPLTLINASPNRFLLLWNIRHFKSFLFKNSSLPSCNYINQKWILVKGSGSKPFQHPRAGFDPTDAFLLDTAIRRQLCPTSSFIWVFLVLQDWFHRAASLPTPLEVWATLRELGSIPWAACQQKDFTERVIKSWSCQPREEVG